LGVISHDPFHVVKLGGAAAIAAGGSTTKQTVSTAAHIAKRHERRCQH